MFNNQGESPAHALLAPQAWLHLTQEQVSKMLQQMTDGGANLNTKESAQEHGFLMRLVDYRHDVRLLAKWIDAGADVDIQDKFNTTALMRAASDGNTAAVQMLLKKNADFTLRDKDGLTASDYALRAGHVEIVEMLKHKSKND